MKANERIKQLETEIIEFDQEVIKRQNQIQGLQNEIKQLIEGILTRRGGIIELKKLEINDVKTLTENG